jgi:uncharacterized protein (DUF1778 family)
MAARLKDNGRSSSVQYVAPKAFKQVLKTLENPPRPSAELRDLVARGRALRAS